MKYEVHLKNVEDAISIQAEKFELIKIDDLWFYVFATNATINNAKNLNRFSLEPADVIFAYDSVSWVKKITD